MPEYCRVSIKLTPLHDHDMPDEILVSSPCLEGCDKHKNLPGDSFLSHTINICSEIGGGLLPPEQKIKY